MDGFTKAAAAAGLNAEQTSRLLKAAGRLEAYRSDPEAFEKGAAAMIKQAGPGLQKLLHRLGIAGLITGGAAIGAGAPMAAHAVRKSIQNTENGMERQEYIANKARQAQNNPYGGAPGMMNPYYGVY